MSSVTPWHTHPGGATENEKNDIKILKKFPLVESREAYVKCQSVSGCTVKLDLGVSVRDRGRLASAHCPLHAPAESPKLSVAGGEMMWGM